MGEGLAQLLEVAGPHRPGADAGDAGPHRARTTAPNEPSGWPQNRRAGRAGPVPAGERRPGGVADRRRGAHRGVRHRGGRRAGDRPAGPAGRPGADRPGPGAVRAAGRGGGAPARGGPLHQRGLAGLGRTLAAAVRTGFAPADRAVLVQAAADAAAHPGTSTAVPWAAAGPGQASDAGALVRATTPGPRCPRRCCCPTGAPSSGRLAPVLVPGEPGGAALLHRVLPAGVGPQGIPLVAPARRSPPPPVGRCAAGWGSRPGPGSDATRPRPTPWTPSWPAAAP